MSSCLRDSGIDIVGSIPWGTHISQLLSINEEYYDTVIPYLKAGLLNNERCIWIYGGNISCEDAKSRLGAFVDGIDDYLACGQLLLLSSREWYLEDNVFSEQQTIDKWKKALRDALSSGYDGLRAAADVTWIHGERFNAFYRYEASIDKILSAMPCIVICIYSSGSVDAYEIFEIMRSHSYIITRHDDELRLIKNEERLEKDRQDNEYRFKYRKLVELLPDALVIHDVKSIYFSNEAAAYITGTNNRRKLNAMSLLDFVTNEDRDGFSIFIQKAFMDQQEHYYRCRLRYGDGEVREVGITTTRYDYFGHSSLLSVIRDETPFIRIYELEREVQHNKKLLDEAMEYDRIKTEFLSNISHEFRTPLNVILSAIQLIKSQKDRTSESIKYSKYFKSIKQNCYRLLRLINNLIDITKIDSNFYEIKLQNFNIVELIEGIVISVKAYAENKKLSVDFVSNTSRKVMACDPDQIERIILNLLSNAIKFTPIGGRISVELTDQGDMVRISVKDTGLGIPDDKLKKIFERFSQVDKSLRKQYEGSGIGLSLVEALVHKHDGVISVVSESGRGSEFIIDLPYRILTKEEGVTNQRFYTNKHSRVERINVEFSDIYI